VVKIPFLFLNKSGSTVFRPLSIRVRQPILGRLVLRHGPGCGVKPRDVTFLAHALAVPSPEPEDKRRRDAEIEKVAVRIAAEYEREQGWTPRSNCALVQFEFRNPSGQ
jgi:hypothetical protein